MQMPEAVLRLAPAAMLVVGLLLDAGMEVEVDVAKVAAERQTGEGEEVNAKFPISIFLRMPGSGG